jgi:hypothetical protein
MSDEPPESIDEIVEQNKTRIAAALDAMPLDEIRELVAEIESKLARSATEAERHQCRF